MCFKVVLLQLLSLVISGTNITVKMASQVHKTKRVLWYHKSESVITMERQLCIVFLKTTNEISI